MNGQVVLGDIARVPADALITAVNSGRMWFGGIDGVIQRCAGNHFHSQAAARSLKDGDAFLVPGTPSNRGSFRDVVFVVDDVQLPLHQIVFNGLKAAEAAGCRTVTLPAIRMGVMLGVREKTLAEAVIEIRTGIEMFIDSNPQSIKHLIFVVYDDRKVLSALQTELAGLPATQ